MKSASACRFSTRVGAQCIVGYHVVRCSVNAWHTVWAIEYVVGGFEHSQCGKNSKQWRRRSGTHWGQRAPQQWGRSDTKCVFVLPHAAETKCLLSCFKPSSWIRTPAECNESHKEKMTPEGKVIKAIIGLNSLSCVCVCLTCEGCPHRQQHRDVSCDHVLLVLILT